MDWFLYISVPHLGVQVPGPRWRVPGAGSHVKVPGPGSCLWVPGGGSQVPGPGSHFSGMPFKHQVRYYHFSIVKIIAKVWVWYKCQDIMENYCHHDVEQLTFYCFYKKHISIHTRWITIEHTRWITRAESHALNTHAES